MFIIDPVPTLCSAPPTHRMAYRRVNRLPSPFLFINLPIANWQVLGVMGESVAAQKGASQHECLSMYVRKLFLLYCWLQVGQVEEHLFSSLTSTILNPIGMRSVIETKVQSSAFFPEPINLCFAALVHHPNNIIALTTIPCPIFVLWMEQEQQQRLFRDSLAITLLTAIIFVVILNWIKTPLWAFRCQGK